MERLNELMRLYGQAKTIMSAICVHKGGIDVDNYPGRFFVADLLEFIVAYGEKAGADMSPLRAELDAVADNITASSKPIHEMTLTEFEKMIGGKGQI